MIEPRSILYLDCGGLRVAIERRCNPHLRSRPIVIGNVGRRDGFVIACSAESHQAGVVESMPLARALGQCRDAVVVEPRDELYRDTARQILDYLAHLTPYVEAASPDRVYLDLTGTQSLLGAPADVGARLSREIAARFDLVPAVGVAANKLVARVAAETARPAGLRNVPPGTEAGFLAPLEVERLPGVGAGTARCLADLGIATIGDLAATDPHLLTAAFGRDGRTLHARAQGIDDSPVVPSSARPRALTERVDLSCHTGDVDVVATAVQRRAETLGFRLRALNLATTRLSVGLTYVDGHREEGSASPTGPAYLDGDILRITDQLLGRLLTRRVAVRRLSIRAGGLARISGQLGLFPWKHGQDKQEKLTRAVDTIRRRFGDAAIARACLYSRAAAMAGMETVN